jgi:hypothetical protein
MVSMKTVMDVLMRECLGHVAPNVAWALNFVSAAFSWIAIYLHLKLRPVMESIMIVTA